MLSFADLIAVRGRSPWLPFSMLLGSVRALDRASVVSYRSALCPSVYYPNISVQCMTILGRFSNFCLRMRPGPTHPAQQLSRIFLKCIYFAKPPTQAMPLWSVSFNMRHLIDHTARMFVTHTCTKLSEDAAATVQSHMPFRSLRSESGNLLT